MDKNAIHLERQSDWADRLIQSHVFARIAHQGGLANEQ